MTSVGDDENDGLSSVTTYEKNFVGHLPLHWLQPKDHKIETNLSSFRDLQLKTHQTLYGTTNSTIVPPRDKSPKGSVDAPIRHLVDLINSHNRFCTLSSCSGRLSLFDPNGNAHDNAGTKDETAPTSNFTEASGKGRGSWVLVSHYPVAPEALVEAMTMEDTGSTTTQHSDTNGSMDQVESNLKPWTFRFEPMLLHIAAASLQDGRRLLTVALNMGFRESGLVVTDKRVTVAIRSHSLSTVTPLFPSTNDGSATASLCVPPSYLRALVKDANERLEANWKHLDRLYRCVESVLFEIRSSPPPLVVRNHHSSPSIQALNLWNASSIGPILGSKQEVWIAGGYGCGPTDSNKLPSAKRSSNLFKLHRQEANGAWDMKRILPSSIEKTREDSKTVQVSDESSVSCSNISWWNEGSYPDLQGMASCRLRDSIALFWGGRKSPSAPSDSLLVLDISTNRIATIQDVRGDLPSPRWGHQLIALDGNRAVLLGGCNHEDGAFGDIYVLHYCDDSKNETNTLNLEYIYWERLSIRLPTPRFHFGATLLNGDTIIVMGGLESTRELLRPFECDIESTPSATAICSFKIGRTKRNTTCLPITKATIVKVETPVNPSLGNFESFFCMACCALLSKNLLVVTGGISASSRAEPVRTYWISNSDSSTLRIQKIALDYDFSEESCFDFGALVHHCCIAMTDNEMLLIGGGVPSFAFGESYARSHHLVIDTNNSATKKNNDQDQKLLNRELTKTGANSDQIDSPSGGEVKEIANVIYVSPQHARQTKNSMMQKGWLEKKYRMIKVERKIAENDRESGTLPERMIAIPLSIAFSEAVAVLGESILGHGKEELPLSTSQYASKTKENKR